MQDDLELFALIFEDQGKAGKALQILRSAERESGIKLVNAATAAKDEQGRVRLNEREDVDPLHGAAAGAVLGALIGLLVGPGGAILGAAAGAAAGGMAARQLDDGFDKDFIQELKEGLQSGHSALLVQVEERWSGPALQALEPLEGKVLRNILRKDLLRRMKQEE